MADDITLPGTGVKVVTEDVGGSPTREIQVVKLAYGPHGSFILAEVAGGNGIPVQIVGDSVGSTVDTEDGSVAGGQPSLALIVGLPYHFNGSAWVRGGLTPGKLISAVSTNATNVKGSAGVLGFLTVSNINAAARYLKVYDKATAPTVGTDVPKFTFLIPGNTAGAGTNIPLPERGIAFASGIGLALTTGVGDTDTGAVAANEIVVNYGWN